MKITVSKELLLENLQIVLKAVSSRTTLPILECVLLLAEKEFRLIANDLEMGIETAPIMSTIEESGSIALDAKMLTDIVRRMPGDMIHIDSGEHNVTRIKSGKAEFKVIGLPGEEFPFLPVVEKNTGYSLPANDLKDMIKQTIFSIAIEETKPVLTGELIELHDGSVAMVAVDGFRISYRKLNWPELAGNVSVVVPGKALNELSRIIEHGAVRFYLTDKHILFELENCTLVSRLLEGDFIKYDTVFTADYQTIVYINRQALLDGLERACLLSRDSKRNPVKIEVGKDTLILTSNTESGQSFDELNADIDGVSLSIAFNPRFLIEALRAVTDVQVAIQFTTDLSPCIIRGIDNDSYKYLVLPLRLKN